MRWALIATIASLVACSALVNPDDTRLGGGDEPTCEAGCDDGVSCTVDRCEDGVCVNERDSSLCAAGERCDAVQGCVDGSCSEDSQCDDGLACNGQESCVSGVCENGTPVVCPTSSECETNRCDEATGECRSELDDARCDDGIDCTIDACTPAGCVHEQDDSLCDDGFCFTGARCRATGCEGGTARDCSDGTECTVDSCDPERMMCVSAPIDEDEDGFGPTDLCGEGNDCDDGDPTRFPGAEEVCDEVDQDCDGVVDEGVCEGPAPDTCETAQELTVIGSLVSFTADFTSYENDYDSSCSDRRGPDAVFTLELEEGFDYILDTTGSTADTILAVSDTCGDWEGFAGYGCNDDIGDAQTSRLFLRDLRDSGGIERVYILVDRYAAASSGAGDSYTLNVARVPSSAATCAAAPDISPGGSVVGHIGESARSDRQGSCEGLAFREREHYFVIRSPERVVVDMFSDDFATTLYSAPACDRFWSETGCDNDTPAQIDLPPREQHRIVADGARDGGGLYTLVYRR